MATRNDVTGDELKSRGNSDAYQSGYDRIWGNKNKPEQPGQPNKRCDSVQLERTRYAPR